MLTLRHLNTASVIVQGLRGELMAVVKTYLNTASVIVQGLKHLGSTTDLRFKYSICYCSSSAYAAHASLHSLFKYSICYCSSTLASEKTSKHYNLNTASVIVQGSVMPYIFLAQKIFKYSICYCSRICQLLLTILQSFI